MMPRHHSTGVSAYRVVYPPAPPSPLPPRPVNPFTTAIVDEQQFRSSPVSSSIAIIIRRTARKSIMETKRVEAERKETKRPCCRAMVGMVRARAKGRYDGMGIGRIVLIKRPRNVGRWLNPVIDLEARARRGNRARGKYSNSFITRSKNR